jgi:hypothetical protein
MPWRLSTFQIVAVESLKECSRINSAWIRRGPRLRFERISTIQPMCPSVSLRQGEWRGRLLRLEKPASPSA